MQSVWGPTLAVERIRVNLISFRSHQVKYIPLLIIQCQINQWLKSSWIGFVRKTYHIQCESNPPPYSFLKFFPKRLGIFNQFFTHLLYYHFYARLQIFIEISPTLTKLCHSKRDHLANFYISLEL